MDLSCVSSHIYTRVLVLHLNINLLDENALLNVLVCHQSAVFPRLSDSFAARHAIRMHQLELAKELTTRLEVLKNNIAPAEPVLLTDEKPGELDGDTTVTPVDPILDITELPKRKTDYEVRSSDT